MYSTSDLKRGLILEFEGAPYQVESVQVSSPTARGGSRIHRVRLRHLVTKQSGEHSFRGGETFGVPDVEKRPVQFLYTDPEAAHFMDTENYEQFEMRLEELEWESKFLIEGVEGLRAFYYNGSPIGLELPQTMALIVSETAPGVKGNSATGRTKAATLETGHVVQLPEHIDEGTKVSVDTRTGEFTGTSLAQGASISNRRHRVPVSSRVVLFVRLWSPPVFVTSWPSLWVRTTHTILSKRP